MNTDQVLALARKHLGKCSMESSARLCLQDAVKLKDDGELRLARERAMRSIAYSVGVFHADFKKAYKACE